MSQDTMIPAKLLDVSEVAELFGCSTRHVWRMAAEGDLPAPVKLRRLRRWESEALARWLADGGSEAAG